MNDKELIAEARHWWRRNPRLDTDGRIGLDLADALEARQPREAIFEDGQDFELEAVLRAGFSRAAVPDAATGELARAHDLIDLREFEIDNLHELIIELRAECGAALAAIDRVRAVHRKFTYYELEDSCPDTSEDHREERHHESDEIGEFYCEDMPTDDVVCDLCRDADGERMDWPCPTVAALDGAPEPEWEYGMQDDYGLSYVHNLDEAYDHANRQDPELHPRPVRRRKAGPWLPVEGESKQ